MFVQTLCIVLLKTRGIVFRSIKYSETSIICDVYTEERGLHTFIISGVRSARSKISPALLQVGALVEMVVYFRDDKAMHRIREIQPAFIYHHISADIRRSAILLFMAELCQKTIHTAEKNDQLFEFLFDIFQQLDISTYSVANYHLAFLVDLSLHLGFFPSGEWNEAESYFDMREGIFVSLPPSHPDFLLQSQSQILSSLLKTPAEYAHTIQFTKQERKDLLYNLLKYFAIHIEHMPEIQSHQIFETVFEG